MTDRKPLTDQNETPEDVATLYSWANLHGAKYRDFSASRAQTRESARQRVQESIEDERRRVHEQAELEQLTAAQREADALRALEAARQAEMAAERAAQDAELAASQAARQAEVAAQQETQYRSWQQPGQARFSGLPGSQSGTQYYPAPPPPGSYPNSASGAAPSYVPADAPRVTGSPLSQSQSAPMREESHRQPGGLWPQAEPVEASGRPAWLSGDPRDLANQTLPQALPPAPEDTLQGSRERVSARWYALKGLFAGANTSAPTEPVAPAPTASRAPTIAVFSLAGGVGKTSLVATLGRALSARGERVLLVDTAAYGLLPFYFGARDQRAGVVRTFSPSVGSGDAPIQTVTFDPETLGPDAAGQDALIVEISKHARAVSRVIVDLATASGATTRRVMRMGPLVLVPVVPDMNSVVSVSSIEAFFRHNRTAGGSPSLPYFVLNQFDPTLPLHLDVREVLREQLGDRLLSFALRRTPAVSEALAEGMTVMDYAPNSPVAEDFGSLAGWVKNVSAPVSGNFRGVRWSER